jgi:hypothetical protein
LYVFLSVLALFLLLLRELGIWADKEPAGVKDDEDEIGEEHHRRIEDQVEPLVRWQGAINTVRKFNQPIYCTILELTNKATMTFDSPIRI